MKKLTHKLISVFLSTVVAGGMVTAVNAADFTYGDVDASGKINSTDALCALEHSVGKKTLTGERFKSADVNGDGKVDSFDALDILSFSVGIKSKFDVEHEIQMSDNEILALYSEVIAKARKERPEYVINRTDNCKDADITVKDPFNILKAGGSSASEMEKMMEEELLSSTSPQPSNVCQKGSTNSYENLPAPCKLTDASKLKEINLTVLNNGNYRISIKLNDEKNPTAASTICKVIGVPDYDATLQELKDSADIEGAEGLTQISLDELAYKNLWIICEINPETNELIKYDYGMDVSTSSTMSILTVSVKSVATIGTVANYSSFNY